MPKRSAAPIGERCGTELLTLRCCGVIRFLTGVTLLGALLGSGVPTAAAQPASVGKKAPPFLLEKFDGDSLTLADFAGKPLFINLFATWCPPCRMEMPLIARTSKSYAGRVAFLQVDEQESPSIVAPYLEKIGVKALVAIDQGPFEANYGATAVPESVFIDRHGIVRAIVHGPVDEETLKKDLALIDPGT